MPATEAGTHRLLDFFVYGMRRIRLDADFDWKLDRFGRPCKITLTRSRWRGT